MRIPLALAVDSNRGNYIVFEGIMKQQTCPYCGQALDDYGSCVCNR